jgi:glutaredoxin
MLRKGFAFISFVAFFSMGSPVSAEIYKWVDEQGRSHFSDRAPSTAQAEQLTVKINSYSSPSYTPDILSSGDKQNPIAGTSHKVTIYSTSWCGVCQKAKAYFKTHHISYTEYDVEQTSKGRQDFQNMKGRGVPIILVGNKRMNGFTPQLFEHLYQQ